MMPNVKMEKHHITATWQQALIGWQFLETCLTAQNQKTSSLQKSCGKMKRQAVSFRLNRLFYKWTLAQFEQLACTILSDLLHFSMHCQLIFFTFKEKTNAQAGNMNRKINVSCQDSSYPYTSIKARDIHTRAINIKSMA